MNIRALEYNIHHKGSQIKFSANENQAKCSGLLKTCQADTQFSTIMPYSD